MNLDIKDRARCVHNDILMNTLTPYKAHCDITVIQLPKCPFLEKTMRIKKIGPKSLLKIYLSMSALNGRSLHAHIKLADTCGVSS